MHRKDFIAATTFVIIGVIVCFITSSCGIPSPPPPSNSPENPIPGIPDMTLEQSGKYCIATGQPAFRFMGQLLEPVDALVTIYDPAKNERASQPVILPAGVWVFPEGAYSKPK